MQRSGSPSSGRGRWLALAACVCAAGTWGCTSLRGQPPPGPSSVRGEVRIAGGPGSVANLGPVVVYLEQEHEGDRPSTGTTLTVSDGGGDLLGHELVVLSRGQALRFASQSGVAHRLFAMRGQERLDVGVSEGGQSRVVPMEQAGWIRFYCSLHQDETWDVFVSPSPHFARLDPDGGYHIENVPPGDYNLSIWSAAVDGTVRRIRVGFRTSTLEPIWLDPAKIDP